MQYSDHISNATGIISPQELRLIEEWMRQQTGGCLDHLSRAQMHKLARQSRNDLLEFSQFYPQEYRKFRAATVQS